MHALICGSMAYDTIMVFPERFKDHILPDQVHILNVAFLVPRMQRNFGGCSGNIAYNMKLLGGNPLPMAAVGTDFRPYREYLEKLDIPLQYVTEVSDSYTAQAFITTDLDDNQITAFHPGAMEQAHVNHVREVNEDVKIGIVAPDGRDAMFQHSEELAEQEIPQIFDPGQAMPMFQKDDLLGFIDRAQYLCANDYEAHLLCDRTGLSEDHVAARLDAMIVTHGAEGSTIRTDGKTETIQAVKADKVVDPTGCGDAYRAGLIWAMMRDMDLPTAARVGSLMGSIKVQSEGPQNHHFSADEFAARFKDAYGYSYE